MLSLRTSLITLALTTFTFSAAAAEPRITVDLKDGSSIRGEVVERVPGKHVTLSLATGEVRTLEWSSIARIDEPPASPPSQTSGTSPEGIAVHISTDDPRSTLQRRAGTSTVVVTTGRGTAVGQGESWEDLCVAPCDQRVARNQTLRLAGDGITPSGNFVLQRDAKLDVKTGSAGRRVGGFWLAGAGLGAAAMGGLFLALDARKQNYDSRGGTTDAGPVISPTFTYGLLIGGVLALAGGIALIVTSGTSVQDETGGMIGKAMRPGVFTF